MAIKVRSQWRLAALTAGLVLLGIMIPAQAADPPKLLPGDTNCSSSVVNTSAESSLTLSSFSSLPKDGVGGAKITMRPVGTDNFRTSFSFVITGGVVFDVVVKGSGAYQYSYPGGTLGGTDILTIPNGNKLNVVHFCYTAGTPLACGGTVPVPPDSTPTNSDPTGSFTLDGNNCVGFKVVDIRILDNNTVLFVPSGGSESSQYTGTVVFTKNSSDTSALVLKYDKVGDGAEFFIVPDCGGDDDDPTLLDPELDLWCVVSATAAHNSTTGGVASWTFTWKIYGEGDPRLK